MTPFGGRVCGLSATSYPTGFLLCSQRQIKPAARDKDEARELPASLTPFHLLGLRHRYIPALGVQGAVLFLYSKFLFLFSQLHWDRALCSNLCNQEALPMQVPRRKASLAAPAGHAIQGLRFAKCSFSPRVTGNLKNEQ